MADLIVTQGDTWPPVRGAASDEDGLMDLTTAASLRFQMESGAVLVAGSAVPIDPPDDDGFNWQYTWGSADTAVVGEYNAELEITWDAGPPEHVQTVPNESPLIVEVRAEVD